MQLSIVKLLSFDEMLPKIAQNDWTEVVILFQNTNYTSNLK